jgi:Protein of unknown function (DUF3887)
MKRGAAVLGLLASMALWPTCSSSSPGPFASQADQVVADPAAGNFTAVEAKFDPALKAHLTLPTLQNVWTTYQKMLGSCRNHGAPTFARVGQLDVERVPVTMAYGPGEVSISFRPDGTMAGWPLHCRSSAPQRTS